MTLWLVRAGKYGEHETKFFSDNRVYATWEQFSRDMGKMSDRQELRQALQELLPDASPKAIINYSGQLWPFVHEMEVGDWFALPLKTKAAITIGEIAGPYEFNPDAEDPYYHSRKVKWLATNIPRSTFDQDLLYSFGAFMTICRIARNDAEARVHAMATNDWKPTPPTAPVGGGTTGGPVGPPEETVDLEQLAKDQIAKQIIAKFKGHGMARLVEALLQARGYTTFRSPEGADKGVDIVAASGPLGFGQPRICVQVKSGQDPVDHPTLSQLIGTMQNVQADHGLLVAWGGFKSTVEKETAQQFFRVRFWDQDDLIEEVLKHYDKLEEKIRADLPLKRVWTVAWAGDES